MSLGLTEQKQVD